MGAVKQLADEHDSNPEWAKLNMAFIVRRTDYKMDVLEVRPRERGLRTFRVDRTVVR